MTDAPDPVARFAAQLDAHESVKTALNAIDLAERHLDLAEAIEAALARSGYTVTVHRDGVAIPAGHVPFALSLVFRLVETARHEETDQ